MSVDFVDCGVTEGCLNAAPFRGEWSWLSRSRLRESVRSVLSRDPNPFGFLHARNGTIFLKLRQLVGLPRLNRFI